MKQLHGAMLSPLAALGLFAALGWGVALANDVVIQNGRVIDPETGLVVPTGETGELLTRGYLVMLGYWDNPEATAATIADGWLDTGDLGFLDSGELFLTGREKEMLLLRGRNHAPDELERAMEGVAGVRTGCTIAASWLPEGAGGESLLLLAVGLAIGDALAWLSVKAIEDGVDISAVAEGMEMMGAASVLYPRLYVSDMILANVIVLFLGFLASLSPAWRASRYEPVEAITKVG